VWLIAKANWFLFSILMLLSSKEEINNSAERKGEMEKKHLLSMKYLSGIEWGIFKHAVF